MKKNANLFGLRSGYDTNCLFSNTFVHRIRLAVERLQHETKYFRHVANLHHPNNNVIVWSVRLAELPTADLERYCQHVLADDEFSRADQFRFERDRKSFLAGRLLTRLQLAERMKVSADRLRFEQNDFGKPHLSYPSDSRLYFSRSQTKEMVASAVAHHSDIGLDIERVDLLVEVDSIADQFFATEEIQQLRQCPDHSRHELFFRFWTLKEAYIKAIGKGLTIPLDEFAFDLANNDCRVSLSGSAVEEPDNWFFEEFVLGDHHQAAFAMKGSPKIMPTVKWIDRTEFLVQSVTFPT